MGKVLQILEKSNQKKVKKDKKSSHTRVHFILDESGSMFSCWHSTISGFNEYVKTLKNDKNKNTYDISLTKFEGGNIVKVFNDVPVNTVEELTSDMYRPSGDTNLNDAIGVTITKMMETKTQKKQNTLIIIMTDGYENSSTKWTKDQIANLIKEQEKKGWTVTFLGANIDTVQVGAAYSIKSGNMKSYSTENMAGTMRGLGAATSVYACSTVTGSSSDSFFEGTDDWTKTEDDKQLKTSALNLGLPSNVNNVKDALNPFITHQINPFKHISENNKKSKRGGRK